MFLLQKTFLKELRMITKKLTPYGLRYETYFWLLLEKNVSRKMLSYLKIIQNIIQNTDHPYLNHIH